MRFRTIDLFAGIGGMRLGFELTGKFENVFSVEIDKHARKVYQKNFEEIPYPDINNLIDEIHLIPKYDVLLAGFPCQPFSTIGKKKGRNDIRGELFFSLAIILMETMPKAFLLENVKGLLYHDDFYTIYDVLRNIGYDVYYKVLNSKNYGIPQQRNRLYIVGFRNDLNVDKFTFPKRKVLKTKLKDLLEKEVNEKYFIKNENYLNFIKNPMRLKKKYTQINGDIALTQTARQYQNWNGTFVTETFGDKNDFNHLFANRIRKLTPRECARLQGFPDSFKLPVTDNQAYRLLGNSVTVNVVKALAENIYTKLNYSYSKFFSNDLLKETIIKTFTSKVF